MDYFKGDQDTEKTTVMTSKLPIIDLPIINYEEAFFNGKKDQEASKLIEAFTEYGFCLLSGLDKTGYDKAELKKCVQWFYSDVSSKERFEQLAFKGFNPNNSNIWRGLFPTEEGKMSWKEAYDLGNPDVGNDATLDPCFFRNSVLKFPSDPHLQAEADHFYNVMYKHFEMLNEVGRNLMSLIAFAAGVDEDYFVKMVECDPAHPYIDESTMRMIKYPKRNTENIPKKAILEDGRGSEFHSEVTVKKP